MLWSSKNSHCMSYRFANTCVQRAVESKKCEMCESVQGRNTPKYRFYHQSPPVNDNLKNLILQCVMCNVHCAQKERGAWWIQMTWHMGDHLCCSAQWDRIWIPIEWFPSGSNLFALQTVPRLSRQPRSPKSGVNSYKLWRYLMKSSNDNMDFQQQQNHTKDTKYHRERVQTTNQMLDLQSTRLLMLQLCGWTVLPLRSAQKILHTRQTLHF